MAVMALACYLTGHILDHLKVLMKLMWTFKHNPGILENPGKSVLGEWDTWVSNLVLFTCLSPVTL